MDAVPRFANYPCLGKELKHFHSQVKDSHRPPRRRGDLSQPQIILTPFTPCGQGDFFFLFGRKEITLEGLVLIYT